MTMPVFKQTEETTSWGTVWNFVSEDSTCKFSLYMYSDDPDDCYLSNVWVEPSKRGRGLGNIILDMAEKTALEFGADELRLEVEQENEFAENWYSRHGYEEMSNPGTKPSRKWMKKELIEKMTETKIPGLKKITMLYESVFSQASLREAAEGIASVQGLEHMARSEIVEIILEQVHERLADANVMEDEVSVLDAVIVGSRGRGTARDDSDLDVVLAYEGTMREDDLFNILNDPDYENGKISVEGFDVDVNPVRKEESGTLEQVLKKSNEYDRKILAGSGR